VQKLGVQFKVTMGVQFKVTMGFDFGMLLYQSTSPRHPQTMQAVWRACAGRMCLLCVLTNGFHCLQSLLGMEYQRGPGCPGVDTVVQDWWFKLVAHVVNFFELAHQLPRPL
jgi:hypothetical protein